MSHETLRLSEIEEHARRTGREDALQPADSSSDDSDAEEPQTDSNEEAYSWDIEALREDAPPVDTGDITVEHLALHPFPDIEDIVGLCEDTTIGSTTDAPPESVIDPENGVFVTLSGTEVLGYIRTIQAKTDWWLNNELESLLQRTFVSQSSSGFSKPKKLSTLDKKWLVLTEKERRMESPSYEWNPVSDSEGWQKLPRDPEAEWVESSSE